MLDNQNKDFDLMLGTINGVLRKAKGSWVDSVDLIEACGLQEAHNDEYTCQLFNAAIEFGEQAGWFAYSCGEYRHLRA
tara:strand:- start:1309 stop:1542 length:234 start_codon:yes stop_codon:yes gene_type:complete